MAFTAAVTYQPQLDPSVLQFADTSNYVSPDSKSNFTARTLTILQSDNSPLPGYTNPINWPYGSGDTIQLSIATDYALQVVMTLTPIVVNSGSTYTAEADIATERYLQQGLFNIQVQRLNNITPSSIADQIYRTNSIDLIIEQVNAQTGILYSNFTGAQQALDRGEQIIANTTL